MKHIVLVMAVLALLLCSSARAAAPEYSWTLANHTADDSVESQTFYHFAKLVAEKTGGRMEILVSTGAQLGGEREIVELTNIGGIEMGMGEAAQYTNYVPAFGVMVMPFMHSSREKSYEAQDGAIGSKLSAMLAEQTGMQIFAWLDGGGYRDVYSTYPIPSIDDLKGVKIRTP